MTSSSPGRSEHSSAERRAQRRRHILDTALDVIGEAGVAGLRIRALCVRARLNDRYFYESFRDCDQLAVEVFEGAMADATRVVLDAFTDGPDEVAARTRAVLAAGVAFVADDQRRARLLIESQTTEALRHRRGELVQLLAQIMLAQGRQLLGADAMAGQSAELAALTVVHGELELVTQWLRHELDIDREQFIDFLTAMILTAAEINIVMQTPRR